MKSSILNHPFSILSSVNRLPRLCDKSATDRMTKSGWNGHFWRKKKSFFITTIHQLTHRTLHWQKSMNWVLNRFRIHCILQTWHPATIICSITSRNGCGRRFVSNEEVVEWKTEGYFRRELEWYICCRIYAAVKQGLSLAELPPCHAVLMQS